MLFSRERGYDKNTIDQLQESYGYYRTDGSTDKEDAGTGSESKKEESFPIKEIILSIFISVILAFLIGLFLKYQKSKFVFDKAKSKIEMEEELDEHTEDSDLQLVLNEALRQEDYSMSIRVVFLLTIQGLGQRELIKLEKGRTAKEYINALSDDRIYKALTDLNYLYNYSWYGGFTVTKIDYIHSEKLRQELLR